MLSCKQATQLISEALDRKLSLGQRVGLRFHVMMCSACRAYRRQLVVLNDLFSQYFSSERGQSGGRGVSLPEESRQRIKRAIRIQAE
ncbi:MAG: zf-HC2 domain-containing protein [Planctomycetia bacterium]|nr:zf-HC2 domain-containing protein [Planctomycetia bacterium]